LEGVLRLIYVPVVAGLALGCAPTSQSASAAVVHPVAGEVAALDARSETQARRITELEARLGMMEAETREMRAMLQQRDAARPDVVRIGANRNPHRVDAEAAAPPPPVAEVETAPTPSRERRPLLRSIREPASVASAPVVMPVAPPGVPDRLPVAPLPSASAAVAPPPVPALPSANPQRARDEYRAALTLVSNRDFDSALSALTEFISKYPDHEFTDRAMFWRAEAFYAKRDYERALAEFEALSARFPRTEKAADTIFKIGMCHQRLGDEQRAQVFFQRVVEQFPESAAARAASKEGA